MIPSIDGLDVKSLGTPSRSTRITTINGHTTTSTTQTFAFELTPQRSGTFQVPAISVSADGVSQHTRPVEFVASKSETGDLLFVEIAGKQKQIYVGQALDLTLKIWLRPYSEREHNITLSEGDMWKMITDRSKWGPFAERLQEYADNDQRPAGKEVLRKDLNGVEHSYYLYEINATIYPKRPGNIDGNNVKIVVDYPTALGRARDPFAGFFEDMPFPGGRSSPFGGDDGFSPFGSRLTVRSVRPLVTQAVVEPIRVLPIPTTNRPDDYRGAVGQYQIAVDASPAHIKAGDPIDLLIGVSGTGPMELVQAPPLAELPKLTADFKVPNEPLAGFVKGDRKIFSTSIRPRKAGITQIPAIPFSYFDPAVEKFVTVHSAPISIQVDPAEMLALDSVVHGDKNANGNSSGKQTAVSRTSQASLAIFTGDDLFDNEKPFRIHGAQLLVLLSVAPLAAIGLLLLQARTRMLRLVSRFGSASGRYQKTISHAKTPDEIAVDLKEFIAHRYKLRDSAINAEIAVGAIRSSGHRHLALRCERLLNECSDQSLAAALRGNKSLDDLKHDALQWIEDCQTEYLRQRPKPRAELRRSAKSRIDSPKLTSTTARIITGIVVGSSLFAVGGRAFAAGTEKVAVERQSAVQQFKLTETQKRTLLTEANQSYETALKQVKGDSAEAKQKFADAADKYQLLVRAGVQNSRLYFNLGNAYLESGQLGEAIANYHRCLRIVPNLRKAQSNLAYAEQLLHSRSKAADSKLPDGLTSGYAFYANQWLSNHISPRAMFVAMVVAWFALWTAIGLRLANFRFPWKSATCVFLLLFLFTASSTALTRKASSHQLGVIVQPPSELSADAAASNAALHEGQLVELLQRRGDTVRIRTNNGQVIWLPDNAIENI